MFSGDLDTASSTFSTRKWGIILGTIIMVAVAAALISARTIPFTYTATVVAFIVVAPLRARSEFLVPRVGMVSLSVAAFLLYALISAIWAIEPSLTIFKTTLAILIMLGTIAVCQLIVSESHPNLLHMAEGVWIGLLVGLLYFLVEILTNQSIKIWLFNMLALEPADLRPTRHFRWAGDHLVAISRHDLARNTAPITPLLWPAVLALQGTLVGRSKYIGSVVLIALASVVVMLSPHETSKLALLAGLVIFGCAFVRPRSTSRLVTIGWVSACLMVVPAALVAHRHGLHNASWLQKSAQQRIEIWHATAEDVFRAPFLGIGAHSTYVQHRERRNSLADGLKKSDLSSFSTHAHNVYLQTWYELGLVGAALLTLVGLSFVKAISNLARAFQPYAYATFTSAAVVAAFSYGMWQIWFMAMFGYCVALFWIGRSVSPK